MSGLHRLCLLWRQVKSIALEKLQNGSGRRIGSLLLNLLGWVGSLFFLILVWRQATAVDWQVVTVDWNLLVLACGLLIFGQAVQSQLAWITQQALGYSVPRLTIHRVWFLSQIAKYIPGSLWQIAVRTGFYVQRGVPLGIASAATMWELVVTVAGSLVIVVFSFVLGVEAYWLSLGAGLLVLLAIVFYMLWPWRLLLFFRVKLAAKMIDALTHVKKRYDMLFSLFALSVGVWLVIGSGFYFLARAFGANEQLTFWNALITFNVAYSIGFLVIVAPSGLGVREVILSFFLAAYFPPLTLAAFVLIARLWWIGAEGINVLAAVIGKFLDHSPVLAEAEE